VYTVRDHSGQATSATVTIDVYPTGTALPTAQAEPAVVVHADLTVTKTVSPKVAAVGDVLTYTVTVTNSGPDATAAVTADGPGPDPSTDHATAVADVLAAPQTITKRASATHVHSGAVVSFTIRVTNRSDAPVQHISVCDRLPAELTRISGGTVRERRCAGRSPHSRPARAGHS
jgi:uncharacterized repeat protein (TIGR01451 family)